MRSVVAPYWASASSAAGAAGLRLCFELEPGAAVYNVSTFEQIAEAGEALAVNLDPSHLFWQSMEPLAVVRRLGARTGFDQVSEQHRWSRDFTRLSLFRALREVVACFPVYRTYIRPERGEVGDDDRRRIQEAVRVAKRRNPAMSPTAPWSNSRPPYFRIRDGTHLTTMRSRTLTHWW